VGSPASVAGVRVGDEILTINGGVPGTASCEQSGWSIDGVTTSLVLRRGSENIPLKLDVVRVASLLKSPKLALASTSMGKVFISGAPFTFGFTWNERSGYIEVGEIEIGLSQLIKYLLNEIPTVPLLSQMVLPKAK
jgi:C-terminal processing protease CtpA/Prc